MNIHLLELHREQLVKAFYRIYGQITFAPVENVYCVFSAAWDTYFHHRNSGENAESSNQWTSWAAEDAIRSSLSYQ